MEPVDTASVAAVSGQFLGFMKLVIFSLAGVIAAGFPFLFLFITKQLKKHNEIEIGFTKAMDDSTRATERMSDTLERVDETITRVHEAIMKGLK